MCPKWDVRSPVTGIIKRRAHSRSSERKEIMLVVEKQERLPRRGSVGTRLWKIHKHTLKAKESRHNTDATTIER